jgi:peptide/nickel transport system permease protein
VGRDVLARFMLGARISMFVGAVVVVVGAALGGLVGLLAGVVGGWLDAVLMRLMDAILAFPPLVLAMAVTVGLGAGLGTAAIGVIVSALPWYARVVRSEVIRVKAQAFVESTYAIGASRTRLIARHIVPHVLPIVLIQAAAAFGSAVLALAALGFVGLGAQLPTPEWGAMITDGLQYTLTGEWWVGLFPGLGLLVAVTAASVLADRMRDVLDPRGEQSRG